MFSSSIFPVATSRAFYCLCIVFNPENLFDFFDIAFSPLKMFYCYDGHFLSPPNGIFFYFKSVYQKLQDYIPFLIQIPERIPSLLCHQTGCQCVRGKDSQSADVQTEDYLFFIKTDFLKGGKFDIF